MRESIGGTMLFWIVLFFMAIFIGFMACVIHYSRVYKIKNSMINYIERSEGIKTEEEFRTVLNKLGYPATDPYVICRCHPSSLGWHYFLKLYAEFQIPFTPNGVRVEIRGETRTIETGTLIKDFGENGSSWFSGDVSKDQCFTSGINKQYESCADAQ